MAQAPSPTKTVTNPRIAKLIELETRGVIKPEHEAELNTYRAQGLAPAAASGTEDQGKSAGYLTRATGANTILDGLDTKGLGPRTLVGQTLARNHPDFLNTLPSAVGNSDERQSSDQAQREFINATLRRDSGAVISPEEFDNYSRMYFPAPGDTEHTIQQKAESRRRAIEGLKLGAGPLAAKAEQNAAKDGPAEEKKVLTPILEAGSANILGASDKPSLTVDIRNEASVQTPEFRAGLAKLLDDPSVTVDQIRDYWAKNAKGGLPDTPANVVPDAPLAVQRGKNGVTDRIDAALRGAADTATLGFADEISGLAHTAFGGTMAENLARERGTDLYDQNNYGVSRFLGQLGGGAVLPFGEARTAGELAKVGGAYGAAYGFGSGEGLGDRFLKAGAGAATGAAGGAALGKLSDLFVKGPPNTPPGTGNAVFDAAARRDIPVVAADVAPGARGATSLLESVPFSGGIVRKRLQAGNDAIERQVGDLAGGMPASDRTAVGETVQSGAQNWIRKSGEIGGKLYSRAQELAGDAAIQPENALKEIDAHIADLSRAPGANQNKLNVLKTIRSDLVDENGAPKPLDIDTVRQIRANARELMQTGNIRSSDLDRRLDSVMDGVNQDIAQGLSGNPRALAAYGRADSFWKDRAQRVDNVLSKVIGKSDDPISGEQVMAKIESMAAPRTGNSERLGSLLSSLRPDEREQVASNIAGALGRAAPDADFSAQRFLTQVNKLSPRARVQIFGKNGAEALSDLATIAEARAGTVSKLNNSGSGRVSNYFQAIKGLMGLGGGAGLGAAVGIGAGAGAVATAGALGVANVSARLLTNPAMARWAAQGLRVSTVQGVKNSIARLGQIATSNPAIRAEVLGIQSKLLQAVNDNAPVIGRAAASPDEGPNHEQ